MAWGKVDDNLTFHPKVLIAGNEAMGVWVRALAWAMQQLTDGFIPHDIVVAIKGAKIAPLLVTGGLWHEVEGGYQFNDWCEYQPTREQVLGDREAAKERMKKMREKKGSSEDVRPNIQRTNTEVTAKFGTGSEEVRLPRPDPTPSSSKEEDKGRAKRIPTPFPLTSEMVDWFTSKELTIDVELETEKFENYFQALAGKNAVKKDWTAAWRNWMLRAQSYLPESASQDPWAGKEHLGFAE